MIDVRTFAKLFNFIILYYDMWRDALKEVRYVEYYGDTRKIYGVFESESGEKYEAYYDAMNYVMSCDCKGYLLRKKPCKHIKFLALLAHTDLNIPLSYIRLGNFKLKYYKGDKEYELVVHKGRIIGKRIR